jgi:hypothetical protein
MNLGDDISNLLRNLGHDAGIYQDLTQYNAAQVARRRLPGQRAVASQAQPQTPGQTGSALQPAAAQPAASQAAAPAASLNSILQRLASPPVPAAPDPRLSPNGTPSAIPTTPVQQAARLDRLFDRLAAPAQPSGAGWRSMNR